MDDANGCFAPKNNALYEVVRYKTRLLKNECFKVVIVDFNKMFAPEAKFIIIRCILAL